MRDARKARQERLADINAKVESDMKRLQWIPEGYTPWSDGSKVAYKQVEGNCNRMRCLSFEVISKDGCPNNLYMKMSIEDDSGRNVGYTNDSTSGVLPRQIALLRLELYQDVQSASGRVTEIKCY